MTSKTEDLDLNIKTDDVYNELKKFIDSVNDEERELKVSMNSIFHFVYASK